MTARTLRYYKLAWKVRDSLDADGISLDLNCPCDRAILDECGLTPKEAAEFLTLWDEIQAEDARLLNPSSMVFAREMRGECAEKQGRFALSGGALSDVSYKG